MKDDRLYLIHILECIERIASYTADGREAFMGSPMRQDAVIRNFEVIGEAAKHLSESFKVEHSEVPWRRVAGFRDILIHDYIGVDLQEVWTVVEKDLPALEEAIRRMMGPS